MLKSNSTSRSRLLGSACATVLALSAGQALAQQATVTSSESFAIQQNQENPGAVVGLALSGNSTGSVAISTGVVVGSTLSVGGALGLGNVSSSTSFGNESVQSIATSLNADTGSQAATGTVSADTTAASVLASSTADVGFAVSQNYADTTTTASNTLNMGIATGAVTDSTLNVQRNTTEAIGLLNRATTSLTANVNSTSATSGIALTQVADTAVLSSTTDATNSIAVNDLTGDDLSSSTASLTGNLQRSVGVGNLSATSQTLTGNDVTLLSGAGSADANFVTDNAGATAGYATGSTQSLGASTLTATTGGVDAGFVLSVDDASLSSTVANSSNTATANLRGNESANAINLTANSIATGTGTPTVGASGTVAAIASVQDLLGSSLTATTMGVGDGVLTEFGGSVTGSTVRSNTNTMEAAATGNQGTNGIVAAVTTLDTSGTINGSALSDSTRGTATGAFAVASAQNVDGASSITASLNGTTTAANVSTTVGNDVGTSTVEANGNTLRALASGNQIVTGSNSISLTGTQIDTTTAVANKQSMDGDVSSLIGTVTARGGVGVTVTDDIASSTVRVDGNKIDGGTNGNVATNSITVSATGLGAGGALTTANVTPSASGATQMIATADNALSNNQNVGAASTLKSDVFGAFGITTEGTGLAAAGEANSAVTSSTLSVSNNTQMATTVANTGTNAVTLSATNLETSAALMSRQSSEAVVTAASDMTVSAPAANTDSTLRLNDNRNQAVATINTATNTVAINATNVTSISSGAASALDATYVAAGVYDLSGLVFSASADSALMNLQQSSVGSVSASATTNVSNLDGGSSSFVTDGVVNSTVDLSRNVTVAEGSANRSINTMTLAGGAASDQTGAVLNVQDNTVDVGATAISTVLTSVTGEVALAAASDSTITVGGNATLGQATGNRASNVLNASALGLTAVAATGATGDLNNTTGAMIVNASYGVLNLQGNAGDVTATVTATYGSDFTLAAGNNAVDQSRVSVMGNSVQGVASGNVASNLITLASLDSGAATSAIGSTQVNSGAIASNVTATMGIDVASGTLGTGGDVGLSTLAMTGNTISSSAVGNSVTSSIVRN